MCITILFFVLRLYARFFSVVISSIICFNVQNLNNVTIQELDNSNGVLFICYDPDTQMVYLCGKVVLACVAWFICVARLY